MGFYNLPSFPVPSIFQGVFDVKLGRCSGNLMHTSLVLFRSENLSKTRAVVGWNITKTMTEK